MPLTVDGLEACIERAFAADDVEAMAARLTPVMAVLANPEEMSGSFFRGEAARSSRDYIGIQTVFQRLVDSKDQRWAPAAGKRVRAAALGIFTDGPAAVSWGQSGKQAGYCDMVTDDPMDVATESTPSAPSEEVVVPAVSSTASSGVGSSASSCSSGELCVDSCHGTQGPMEVDDSDGAPGQPDGPSEAAGSWTAALLAALLPLMAGALPRDNDGICVIPHRHPMERQEASDDTLYLTGSGRPAFRTNKVCDNCQTRIIDRYFYHCKENCDIDFCEDCHGSLQDVFEAFFEEPEHEDGERKIEYLIWVISVTEHFSAHALQSSAGDRARLAHELAFEWPTAMFELLVKVVTDVLNAKVVHVQDVKAIDSDEKFWYTLGFLQFLYSANSLPCGTKRLDEHGSRGPKIEYASFILEGINKCEPISEWQRWREHPSAKVPDVLSITSFGLTADFCSFLTHSNLVPVSFRRVCLLCDIWEQIQLEMITGRVVPLQLQVRRDPRLLLEDVLRSFEGLDETKMRRPLRVTFEGEEGAGPGVTKEFFQVVMRNLLDGSSAGELFRFNEHERTYWFNPDANSTNYSAAFRACGVLLGQAVLNNILVPNIFPRALYERLLEDLESPCARKLGLEDLAVVCPETAQSLQRVLDHEGDDIGEVFGDLDWHTEGRLPEGMELTQQSKRSFIEAYVAWFFHERVAVQLTPLSEGFRTILGCSALLRSMVDAVQLEKIVCGSSVPVDVPAIRRGSMHEGWTRAEETDYLNSFWQVVESFTEAEKVQFVVFVTASDRVPLRGWQDLQLIIRKNGIGDERLPTAQTCFSQLLLPRYSSSEKLSLYLRLAIANSEGFGLK